MDVELDQVEREFVGSSMEDLKARRIFASDEAELRRTRSEKVREKRSKGLVEVAIGRSSFSERTCWFLLYIPVLFCVFLNLFLVHGN